MVTSSPMRVVPFWGAWRVALSWTLVPRPMMMRPLSPRRTAPYQMLAPSPISTWPMMTAVGAMKTPAAMTGAWVWKGMSMVYSYNMNINIVGGGPAGLYFALLMKQADPRHAVTVVERDGPD